MKQLRLLFFCTSAFFIFLSCNRNQPLSEKDLSQIAVADSVVQQNEISPNLKERSFLRTASLKFKVMHVDAAIVEVENKTRALGGYVSLSQLKNMILDSNSIPVSDDSLMQTIHYSTQASLILRVPDYQLDSLLTGLGRLSVMMFNREIHCDDVSSQLLAGQQMRKRSAAANQRLKNDINSQGKKLSDIGEMEKTIAEKEAAGDEAKMSLLNLEDAVNFSTVSIEISQEPFFQYATLAREKFIPGYQTPFFTLFVDALSGGWQILKDLIVSLAKLWSILLIMVVLYLVFKNYFPAGKNILKETVIGKSVD